MTYGPFPEAKDLIAGFWLIQVGRGKRRSNGPNAAPILWVKAWKPKSSFARCLRRRTSLAEIFPPEEAAREQALRDRVAKEGREAVAGDLCNAVRQLHTESSMHSVRYHDRTGVPGGTRGGNEGASALCRRTRTQPRAGGRFTRYRHHRRSYQRRLLGEPATRRGVCAEDLPCLSAAPERGLRPDVRASAAPATRRSSCGWRPRRSAPEFI